MSSAHITPPYLRYMMMLTTLLLVAFPLVLFLQIFQFKLCVLQISNVLGTYHNPPPPTHPSFPYWAHHTTINCWTVQTVAFLIMLVYSRYLLFSGSIRFSTLFWNTLRLVREADVHTRSWKRVKCCLVCTFWGKGPKENNSELKGISTCSCLLYLFWKWLLLWVPLFYRDSLKVVPQRDPLDEVAAFLFRSCYCRQWPWHATERLPW